jgi:ABC-type lipoprotein export system ATPase subunit/ABC-type lipoprotein release transport system permease subunit
VLSDARAETPSGGVRVEDVSKVYRRGTEEVHALRNVTLDLEPGTLTVVLGPSGGGKSTLLHLLGGMDRPTSGSVTAWGRRLDTLSPGELSAYRRQGVGFVFQSFHLLPSLTAWQNVELPLMLAGVARAERQSRARKLLEAVGLGDRLHHKPGQLSGGQLQRVAIARALALDPPLILADEPTGNLDTVVGREIVDLLKKLAHEEGRTVVVVTHNEEIAAEADRVVRLRDGRVVDDVRRSQGSGRNWSLRRVQALKPWDLVGMALGSVGRQATRAVLTGLGVAVGIGAMVLLMGLGAGIEAGALRSVNALGPLTAITVTPVSATRSGGLFGPSVATGAATPLTPAAVRRFKALPGVRAAYPSPAVVATVAVGPRSTTAAFLTLPPRRDFSIPDLLPQLAAGHYPVGPHALLLPGGLTAALFGTRSARAVVGRTVTLTPGAAAASVVGGATGVQAVTAPPTRFTIAGVTEAGADSAGYVPFPTAMAWLTRSAGHSGVTYPSVTVIARSADQVNRIARQIRRMGYGAETLGSVVHTVEQGFSAIETGLGAVGGISLVVAGLMIGVVTSMAVLQRRREIGILRALGATRTQVAGLFLTEAACIGLGGAVIGVALGDGVRSSTARPTRSAAASSFFPLGWCCWGLASGSWWDCWRRWCRPRTPPTCTRWTRCGRTDHRSVFGQRFALGVKEAVQARHLVEQGRPALQDAGRPFPYLPPFHRREPLKSGPGTEHGKVKRLSAPGG